MGDGAQTVVDLDFGLGRFAVQNDAAADGLLTFQLALRKMSMDEVMLLAAFIIPLMCALGACWERIMEAWEELRQKAYKTLDIESGDGAGEGRRASLTRPSRRPSIEEIPAERLPAPPLWMRIKVFCAHAVEMIPVQLRPSVVAARAKSVYISARVTGIGPCFKSFCQNLICIKPCLDICYNVSPARARRFSNTRPQRPPGHLQA